MIMPAVSVLMPTFNQMHFIRRALDSLQAQTLAGWELIIVDDGSTDGTGDAVAAYQADRRIRFMRNARNEGLGAALNRALAHVQSPFVAYLPSDDVYYAAHLASLLHALQSAPSAVLAYSGLRHHYNRTALGPIEGYTLQLAQVLHRRTADRWLEREMLVTDDLERMFWSRLRPQGEFVATAEVTAEWVDHPAQRHKVIQEPVGGINPYRQRYGARNPLRFHSTVGNAIDEVGQYRRFRERTPHAPAPDALKILLVGELAYNAERVLAFAERGHRLYGLWMRDPYWYNTVGPLPFGNVEDLDPADWQGAVRRLRPDVIYALLNWQAVPFAYTVQSAVPEIPFVWHFKEGPFICLEQGTWSQLIDLYMRADGRIYCSEEMRDWFATVVPELAHADRSIVLDGDLPKREWFTQDRAPLLSRADGELHTVVPGRPIGLHPATVAELAAQGIHLHFYGDFTHGQWRTWIETVRTLAPRHLHLHASVSQERWVQEFSRYDAGWLHFVKSENAGDLRRATWDDLNLPARMATLAAAGLPMLQADNQGARVATQTLVRTHDLGLFFSSIEELGAQLRQAATLDHLRENVWRQRERFTFDNHVDRLLRLFRQVIAHR